MVTYGGFIVTKSSTGISRSIYSHFFFNAMTKEEVLDRLEHLASEDDAIVLYPELLNNPDEMHTWIDSACYSAGFYR
jgi:protoporphyrinogen oxidase